MGRLTMLNLRDVIGAEASYCYYSFDGLNCLVICNNQTIQAASVYKTFYEDRYGDLQVGFDVIAKDGSVFVIKDFERNADFTLKFGWKDCGDGDFVPQFCFYDKESVFDGDLIESWVFVDKSFVKSDNYQVKIDVFENKVKLEKVIAEKVAAANA